MSTLMKIIAGFTRITGLAGFIVMASLMSGGTASAAIIVDGTIYDTNPEDGIGVTTIDFWNFTVLDAGTVSFDILSTENPFNDVNGDGEIALIDSYIWLFAADGSLDASDLIAQNDDSF